MFAMFLAALSGWISSGFRAKLNRQNSSLMAANTRFRIIRVRLKFDIPPDDEHHDVDRQARRSAFDQCGPIHLETTKHAKIDHLFFR